MYRHRRGFEAYKTYNLFHGLYCVTQEDLRYSLQTSTIFLWLLFMAECCNSNMLYSNTFSPNTTGIAMWQIIIQISFSLRLLARND